MNEINGTYNFTNCNVIDCEIMQNNSFGGDYDAGFSGIVGFVNINNSILNFTNCSITRTNVKGTLATDTERWYGYGGTDNTFNISE